MRILKEYIETPKISEILREDFMEPLNLSAYKVAKDMGISVSNIQDLLNDKRRVSPKMSIRLGEYFGVSDDYFLNLQNDIDIRNAKLLKRISEETSNVDTDSVNPVYNNDEYCYIQKEIDIETVKQYKELVMDQHCEVANNQIDIKNSVESVNEITKVFSVDLHANTEENKNLTYDNLVKSTLTTTLKIESKKATTAEVSDFIVMSA